MKQLQRDAAAAKQRASKQLEAEAEALRKQEQQASRELRERPQETTAGSSMADESAASAVGQQAEAAPGPAVEGYSVPGLLGLNMLFTRLGFELLAGHTLQRWLSRTVQKRLDDFKRPRYDTDPAS